MTEQQYPTWQYIPPHGSLPLNMKVVVTNHTKEAVDDIVKRLRLYSERMAATRSTVLGLLLNDASDEIERLRKERDEARRMFCTYKGDSHSTLPESLAEEIGWDCFKEAP